MPMAVFGNEEEDFLHEVYSGFYDDSVAKVKAYVEAGKGGPSLYSMAFAGLCGSMPNGVNPDPKMDKKEENCILIGQLLLKKAQISMPLTDPCLKMLTPCYVQRT